MAGKVELDGTTLRVLGHGRTVEMVFADIADWSAASPDQQTRMVERITREVVRRRRADSAGSHSTSLLEWVRPMLALALTTAGIAIAWKFIGAPALDASWGPNVTERPTAAARSTSNDVPRARTDPASSCERVSARISTGGSVTAMDRDGWVMELMLLSDDASFGPDSPKLDAFFAKRDGTGDVRDLVWPEDSELAKLNSRESFVVVANEPLAGVVGGSRAGIRIVWSGHYVGKYFDETARARLQRLAAAVYEATQATHGALYARCALGEQHQIGSWFRGKDLPAATLGVVAAMGAYAEVSHVEGADPRTNTPIEQRRAWDNLSIRAAKFDRPKLMMALAEDGGMVAFKPGRWATITFPFPDANRATRASARLAKSLGANTRY